MKLLSLRDNAIFLSNSRERMRPAMVLSGVILTLLIVSIIITNAYVNPKYIYTSSQYSPSHRRIVPPPQKIFWDIAVGQGILLLLLGTMAANRMAFRERSSGTLEFHRSSPTSRHDQIVGLLLGATSLEWFLFAITLIFSLYFGWRSGIPFLSFFKFYAALLLCAIFYHVLAILWGIMNYQPKKANQPRFGAWQFWLLVWLAMWGGGTAINSQISFIYHLTWLPSYDAIYNQIFAFFARKYTWRTPEVMQILNSLFCLRFPSLLLQILIQISLIAFTWMGISRKISHPERPTLSKTQSLMLCFFILFMFVGSGLSTLASTSSADHVRDPLGSIVSLLLVLCVILGAVGILTLTPSKELYSKGLHRAKKLKLKAMAIDDDYNSNFAWLLIFAVIVAISLFLFSYTLPTVPLIKKIMVLIILVSYIFFFGGALEFFKLKKLAGQKRSLFWTGLSILWIFIPILGTITVKLVDSPFYLPYFTVASPIMGLQILVNALTGRYVSGAYICPVDTTNVSKWTNQLVNFELTLSLVVNLTLAIVLQLMAYRQRHRLQKEILQISD